jgi:hypothetical protein
VLSKTLLAVMKLTLEKTSTMDNVDQMGATAAATTTVFVDFFATPDFTNSSVASSAIASISQFRSQVASRAVNLLDQLRRDYLSGERGLAPAGPYLGKSRLLYEFVRVTLDIRMHGSENYARFVNGLGVEDVSIGENISRIHEVSKLMHGFYCNNNMSAGHTRWKDAIHRCIVICLNIYAPDNNTHRTIIHIYHYTSVGAIWNSMH